jgi:hypothetical protein
LLFKLFFAHRIRVAKRDDSLIEFTLVLLIVLMRVCMSLMAVRMRGKENLSDDKEDWRESVIKTSMKLSMEVEAMEKC